MKCMKYGLRTASLLALAALAPITTAQSVRDMVGQMLMVAYTNAASFDTLQADVATRNLGGVLLFGKDLQNPSQMRDLTRSLQALSTTPLFIATDQEGGRVARLNAGNGFTATYEANTLGNVWMNVDSTRNQAARMAGWLKSVGINTNLAPVADVNVFQFSPAIGALGRSYSPTASTVTTHAAAFIESHRQQGIVTSVKHFPGHGSARSDSHLGFTDITTTWQAYELHPFRDLAQGGFLDMVMTGHLVNRNWDASYPASLSHTAITVKLREELGFNGVVISDELLGMKAITDNFTFDQAVLAAILAGTDILLYNRNLVDGTSLVRRVQDLVEDAIAQERLTEARIRASYDRILALKTSRSLTGLDDGQPAIASGIRLLPNHPNPFNPATVIRFMLDAPRATRLSVHDVLGREVALLVDARLTAGEHEVRFDGTALASGVYLVRMVADGQVVTRRISLVK